MITPIAFATIFFIAANHEHLGGFKWAGMSLGLSVLFGIVVPNFAVLLISQGVLFGFLWRANLDRRARIPQQIRAREEEMRRERQERVRRAREQVGQEREPT